MCGVIGYVGKGASPEFFFLGLKRLEYRGYDSTGIAMVFDGKIHVQRAEGKLINLHEKLQHLPSRANIGIGHTRWATHGRPTEDNAHPHVSGHIALLHNGIIENYREIKNFLQEKKYVFLSDTDTEVAAHLLHYEFSLEQKNTSHNNILAMKNAILNVVKTIKGTFAFGIISSLIPDVLFTAKYASPIIIGLGENENYIASGMTALIDHTKKMIVLDDYELAILKQDSYEIFDFQGNKIEKNILSVDWSAQMLEKNGFSHFMLKEIFEQPEAVAQSLNSRIDPIDYHVFLEELGIKNTNVLLFEKIQIIACGTSFYAGLLAKFYLEKFCCLTVEVELASEYRYRYSTSNNKTLVIAVSQSGETIDTLQAIKVAKENNAQTIALVNVRGSSIGRICDDESIMHAGPEVGVASTKAFSAQVVSLLLLALGFAEKRKTISKETLSCNIDNLLKVSSYIEKTLKESDKINQISQKLVAEKSVLFIGRGPQWPIAMEGALKLKELSYIHAEGFAAGELKHGPIALIDENLYVICIAPKDAYYEKVYSNIHEIKSRGGKIIAIGFEGDKDLESISEHFIGISPCEEIILPFLTSAVLHLLAYWTALNKGCDVDQPRNLAKSVTVE